jgi:nitrite reductase (NADH) small subunit
MPPPSSDMTEPVELIPLARCRRGSGTFVAHGGFELAVFRLTEPERVIVTDNACPHASGNLSGGEVHGAIVKCPWHHWEFDLDRAECVHSQRARLRTYPAEVRNGLVYVLLPVRP